ncbi:MAG: prolipoprotein diacylglyceryl transferase [Candidatus Ornithospirochaeta sp.]
MHVSSYGIMLLLALIASNLVVFFLRKRLGISFEDTVLTEAYMLLGAIIGAKIMYIALSFDIIDWARVLSSLEEFGAFLNSGFVFYGGLFGALLSLLIASFIHKKNFFLFLENIAFVIPLMHGIGRIGCFLSGCCYGIPYTGPLAVVYSSSDTPCFPVQLLEAGLLFLLFVFLLIYRLKEGKYSLEFYLISYSVIRIITEQFRGDTVRGVFLGQGISVWVSVLLLIFSFILLFIRKQIAKRTLR